MSAASHDPPSSAAPADRLRLGMWLFVAIDAMSFVALLGAHALLRARAQGWPTITGELGQSALPLALLSTGLLGVASLGVGRALAASRAARRRALLGWLVATVIAGLGFLVLQWREYAALLAQGKGVATSLFHSTFFVITGYHGAHVAAGVALAAVMLSNAVDGRYTDPARPGYRGPDAVAATALYWHFVDGVWLLILILLYLR